MKNNAYLLGQKVKGLIGIEPMTYRSAVDCSTTELKALLPPHPLPTLNYPIDSSSLVGREVQAKRLQFNFIELMRSKKRVCAKRVQVQAARVHTSPVLTDTKKSIQRKSFSRSLKHITSRFPLRLALTPKQRSLSSTSAFRFPAPAG